MNSTYYSTSLSLFLLISLLLSSVLVHHQALGIRMDKGSLLSSSKLHKFQEDILRRRRRIMDGNTENNNNNNNNNNNLSQRRSCNGRTKYWFCFIKSSSSSSSSSGSSRKLVMMMMMTTKRTSSTSTTTTHSKKSDYDNGSNRVESLFSSLSGNQENFSGDPSTTTMTSKQQPGNMNISTHDGHYSPDIFDLAGMDYSPASRKRPIHN